MTTFRTLVSYLPQTPLGLLPGRWAVQHYCMVCRNAVAAGDLIRHAQAHTATFEGALQDGGS